MARTPPTISPPSAALTLSRAPLLSVEIHVVTPLFGGGALPRAADPTMPIRGSTVRGHLRFWWRACQATRSPTPADLFQAEGAIWGKSHVDGEPIPGPAAIDLAVEVLGAGREVACAEYRRRSDGGWGRRPNWHPGYPPYALFPFQGKPGDPNDPPAGALEGVRFRLTLTAAPHAAARRAELQRAAESAVWAWVTFGGIGARTRRGCGSLFCPDSRFRPAGDLATWLEERSHKKPHEYVAAGQRQLPIPLLAGSACLFGEPLPTLKAWGDAIEPMHQFRQGVGYGRNAGQQPNRPGCSRWPEADTLRQTIPINDPRHPPQHAAKPYYPRVDLGGLPIIFQQMTSRDDDDPRLEAAQAGATRLASPVILKPLAVDENSAVPLALFLNAPHVWDADVPPIRVVHPQLGPAGCTLSAAELFDPGKSASVRPLAGQPTARDGFKRHLRQQWGWREVTL
ncbi:MAG: hypothetical protein HY331_03750 [Chloroflexi bacterium]|nr:hypothetical protein [Chloroflexota bacterium]